MSRRILRVNQLILRELSQIFLRDLDFSEKIFVTITKVETSPNLRESKIFLSILPEEKKQEIFPQIEKQIYFLQQKLNKRLKLKTVPKIRFLEDKKASEAGRIEMILETLKKAK